MTTHPHEHHTGKHPMEDNSKACREAHAHDGHKKSIFNAMKSSEMHGRDAHEKEPSGHMPRGGMKRGD